ncbi:hypothetical protein NX059_000792 [Plenodomus lindquistii]|nr:hypothetical protein NX059_000792 [Plenodomus lindquistii]
MPSLFSKFGKKSNPYMDAQRFDHKPPAPQVRTIQTTASTPVKQLRPVSPRRVSDLLADARLAAGRDPVTGRLRPDMASLTASERSAAERELTEQLKELEERKRIAYQSQAKVKNSMGERFDRLMQKVPANKLANNAAAARRARTEYRDPEGNKLEYYAPERRIGEYYAGTWRT